MKLIYNRGFSNNEKMEWKPVVFNNIVQSFRTIFEAMKELDVAFENPENEVSMAAARRRGALRGPYSLFRIRVD